MRLGPGALIHGFRLGSVVEAGGAWESRVRARMRRVRPVGFFPQVDGESLNDRCSESVFSSRCPDHPVTLTRLGQVVAFSEKELLTLHLKMLQGALRCGCCRDEKSEAMLRGPCQDGVFNVALLNGSIRQAMGLLRKMGEYGGH